ncbi:unnamed protein product [Effrenium voratum]|nr:unnamed protein product [Effrenium voratum]
MFPFRPTSPQTEWQTSTLDDLARCSKRATRQPEREGRLPTPAYKKRTGPLIDVVADSFATIAEEQGSDSESSFGDDASEGDTPAIMPRTRRMSKFSRFSVDETEALKRKAQSLLPDLNLVLERLRSGMEGLSSSEVERYTAAFLRFKDPDGPEMHKETSCPMCWSFSGFPTQTPRGVAHSRRPMRRL